MYRESRWSPEFVTGLRRTTRASPSISSRKSQFESGRIPNPDRIYFDLKDTRLSSVLKGKAFDVDDGFLKKIRSCAIRSRHDPRGARSWRRCRRVLGLPAAEPVSPGYRYPRQEPAKLIARTQQPQIAVDTAPSTKPAEPAIVEKPKVTPPAPSTVAKAQPTQPKPATTKLPEKNVAPKTSPRPIEQK